MQKGYIVSGGTTNTVIIWNFIEAQEKSVGFISLFIDFHSVVEAYTYQKNKEMGFFLIKTI